MSLTRVRNIKAYELAELLEYRQFTIVDPPLDADNLLLEIHDEPSERYDRVARMLAAVGFWLRSYDANLDTCADAALDQIEACVRELRP